MKWQCSVTHSVEMPRSSQAAGSVLSLLLPQVRPEANWQSNAHPCSLTQPALGLLIIHVPTAQGASAKNQASWSSLQRALGIPMEKRGKIPLQQGAQNIWVVHPQPQELPYSCISQLSGKPKVLQNDPNAWHFSICPPLNRCSEFDQKPYISNSLCCNTTHSSLPPSTKPS